jgi:hypothetical protein
MMEDQVQETGTDRLSRLRKEAKDLGIVGLFTADVFETKIAEAKAKGVEPAVKIGLTDEEAKKIDARLKYEEEAREKFKRDRQIVIEVASIKAESESLGIKIDLPDKPSELQLAKARQALGIKKVEVKPSPETIAMEASPKGYYKFTNMEQENAGHTVNPGGKHYIELFPDQIHVLSEWHIKFFRQKAVRPIYGRVSTGVLEEGRLAEECKITGTKPRFLFEHLGEAPKDAPFGLVRDTKILKKLLQTV